MTQKLTVDSVGDTGTRPKKILSTPTTDKIVDRHDKTYTALTEMSIGTSKSLEPNYNTSMKMSNNLADSVEDMGTRPKNYLSTPPTDNIVGRHDKTHTSFSLTENNISTSKALRPEYNTSMEISNNLAGKLNVRL